MLRSVIEQAGLSIFTQIALLIFFAVFVTAVIRVWLQPKSDVQRLENLPLADENTPSDTRTPS